MSEIDVNQQVQGMNATQETEPKHEKETKQDTTGEEYKEIEEKEEPRLTIKETEAASMDPNQESDSEMPQGYIFLYTNTGEGGEGRMTAVDKNEKRGKRDFFI